MGLFPLFWQRPAFPGRLQPSIIGAKELNFRVRYGYGWVLLAITTRSLNNTKTLSALFPYSLFPSYFG